MREGRRYHHILDPRTGLPTEGVRGVSLLAQDHTQVNGLGAAWMVAGSAAAALWLPAGVAAVAVQADGSRWQNTALAARLLPA
jgi:thiamine biosynthesis lipoprotein